jgi:hypothetical protein
LISADFTVIIITQLTTAIETTILELEAIRIIIIGTTDAQPTTKEPC